MINPLKLFALAALIGEVLQDIIKAVQKDSPGGRRITDEEWEQIVDGLKARLLKRRFRKKLEALDL